MFIFHICDLSKCIIYIWLNYFASWRYFCCFIFLYLYRRICSIILCYTWSYWWVFVIGILACCLTQFDFSFFIRKYFYLVSGLDFIPRDIEHIQSCASNVIFYMETHKACIVMNMRIFLVTHLYRSFVSIIAKS